MGKVIGPFEFDSWYLMRELRSSIRYMLEHDRSKYSNSIRKETEIYNEELDKYLKNVS